MKQLKLVILVTLLGGNVLPVGMHYAAAHGIISTIKKLLLRGANVNELDEHGNTPLHYVSEASVAGALLKHGADVDAKNDYGVAPLHVAVVRGKPKLTKKLLSAGANVNIVDSNGITPLHLATAISYLKNKSALLNPLDPAEKYRGALASIAASAVVVGTGAASSSLRKSAWEALSKIRMIPIALKEFGKVVGLLAITFTAIAAVDVITRNRVLSALLNAGAQVNALDNQGNTPLHILAGGRLLRAGNRRDGVLMAQKLIVWGADPNIENEDGHTPYDVARKYNRFLLKQVLKRRQFIEGKQRIV